MNGMEFFDGFLGKLLAKQPDLVAQSGIKSQAVSVSIDGPTGGQWTLSFDAAGNAELKKGEQPNQCLVSMNEKTWSGLLDGTINVPMAVVMRKIKIKGETGLAAKLGLAIRAASKQGMIKK